MKHVLVISNFKAGRMKAISYKKKLQKFLLKNVESFKFISIEELDSHDTSTFDTIIAMGGDGTISKILPFALKHDITLGIIPTGTANLLAENLKIPNNINKAIEVLERGSATLVDIMQINERYSSLRFGIGYDSDIISKTPQSLKNNFGYFAYFIAGILFALRLKSKEYELSSDGKTLKINASCIIIANAVNMYRNWFRIGESAPLNDGLFDIFILRTQNPIMFFFELVKIALNIHQNSSHAIYFRTDNLKIKNKLLHAHIDGEKTTLKTDIEIKILPSAIKLLKM